MDLRLTGREVVSVEGDYQVVIEFADKYFLTFESPFSLEHGDVESEVSPEEGVDHQPQALQNIVGDVVTSSEASDSGRLQVELDSSTIISDGPDGEYEAWNLAGPGGFKVVCLPSGELATWAANDGADAE